MVGQLGQLGVTTVQVDGLWYVSPSRSVTDVLLVALQGLEEGDIETLIDFAETSLEDLSGDWASTRVTSSSMRCRRRRPTGSEIAGLCQLTYA